VTFRGPLGQAVSLVTMAHDLRMVDRNIGWVTRELSHLVAISIGRPRWRHHQDQ
jgi:hypothetical protein